MKRIYILILSLLLLIPLQGQILRYSNYTLGEPPAETPDFYDEYDAVYAAFTTKPNSIIAGYQEDLVYSLDTCDFAGGASVWDRMDLFYVFATHTNGAGEALINWANPGTFNADDPTTVQWDNLQGYTGDGASDYISTNWAANTNAVNWSVNSASGGIYIRNDLQEVAAVWAEGSSNRLMPRHTDGYAKAYITSSGLIQKTAATSLGLFIATRTASNALAIYQNGSSLGTDTDASDVLSGVEMIVLARPTGSEYSAHQVSIFFVMNGVTSAEAAAINTIIETYMDAIGYGVQ